MTLKEASELVKTNPGEFHSFDAALRRNEELLNNIEGCLTTLKNSVARDRESIYADGVLDDDGRTRCADSAEAWRLVAKLQTIYCDFPETSGS